MRSTTIGGVAVAAMLALWTVGCSTSHQMGSDAGEGEACGPATCAPGTECCNASCGICVRPGESCAAIACIDAGPPTTACGGGTCTAGERCCPGCEAGEGFCVDGRSPCPDLSCPPTVDAGMARTCGGLSGATCGPDEVCDYPDGSFCGGDDSLGVCIPRPTACAEPECPMVCGCDGETYCSECEAHVAGVDVLHAGECPTGDCAPMDARGEGLCDGFFGIAWDGVDCRAVSGCSCEGADCDALFESSEACIAAYSSCFDDCRATGCPDGQTCQPCWADFECLPEGVAC